jgi:cytoskeletal protein RodZ
MTLGEEFRAAREARGLTLSDVAEQIHIRSVYLAGIESEDWTSIGAPVYVRGFIRTYARFLALDIERAVQIFNECSPSSAMPPPVPDYGVVNERERNGPSPWIWVGAVVAVALLAFVGYEYFLLQAAPRTTVTMAIPAQPSPSPRVSSAVVPANGPTVTSPTPTASATSGEKNALFVKLSERSWLRVVVDGKSQMEGIFPAGTQREFKGKSAVVRAGNAGGVDLTVNGKSVGKLGASGDVVERTFSLAGE